jgi:Cohesin domain
MKYYFKKIIGISVAIFLISGFLTFVYAFDIDTTEHIEISLSPRSGSFVEGSTFQVPVLINTNNRSIDGIDIKINFDKNKFSIVDPSGGKSIIGSWTESPSFDNTQGIITYIGTIPEGIVTQSGLVATITFKAISSGTASIEINPTSKISLHDELGTTAVLDLGRAEYSILKKTSEGVSVFSETHPLENKWYNNNSPVLSWKNDVGVTGFSFVLDNKPFTIPDNTIDTTENITSFNELTDGLWYFHIKAIKNGAWGTTGHFVIKIDTAPPAPFNPVVNNFSASAILSNRTLVSFFTTDNLSGIDHYEIGTIDTNQPISQTPVFIEMSSPFQVPISESSINVIVRAIDKAGNIREGYLAVGSAPMILKIIKNNLLLVIIILFTIITLIGMYLWKHRVKYSGTLTTLETNLKDYVLKRKEINERNVFEKDKIEALEKELENAKLEIDKEIKNTQ